MSKGDESVTAADFLPSERSLNALRDAAAGCRGCSLHRDASQVVFGEGLKRSRLMLVGEMPGNDEDLAGQPFVGPAGRILNSALERAGIERSDAYVTNAVKHFKWEQRGKRRLHKTPTQGEVTACRPWLDAEIELVQPTAFVCLGATAARALLGREFRVSRQHGEFVPSPLAPYTTATTHPSAVLRARDLEARERTMEELVVDLARVAEVLDDA